MSVDSTSSAPSPRALGPAKSRAGHRRGTWWKRVIIAMLVLANLFVFGVYWTLHSAQSAFRSNASALPDVVPELTVRPTDAAEPLTFLVIGSDTREGLDNLQNFGESGGARGDLIMLMKLYPTTGSAQILSIPRDLLVEIPGKGTNRINAAYSFGGAPLMVRTVREVIGLPIHHYVEIDFVGFQSLVDEIGGVTIDFPFPARDANSGLNVEAGKHELDGAQALAYARSRHYEEFRGGEWKAVDATDFGRSARQQRLILAILSALKTPSTLAETGQIVGSFASHLSVDSALLESSLVRLAFSMRGISGSKIETATLPGYIDTFEEMSIVRLQHPEADNMIADFSAGQPMTVQTDEPLRISVLNGNGTEGSAGRWSEILAEKGFEVLSVGDAESKDFETTTVIVRPDGREGAQAIIDALGFGEISTGSVDTALDAVVIVGKDAARMAQTTASS
jgi:LCP family protein required for cell wall assembly